MRPAPHQSPALAPLLRPIVTSILSFAALLALPTVHHFDGAFRLAGGVAPALADPASSGEKDAFNAAKELGTVEAWDAFLSNYPKGFHADLARAYVRKLGGDASMSAAGASAAVVIEPAMEEPCSMVGKLKSYQSTDPVKIRFVNQSGAVRVIQWIDFDGSLKEYFELKPGEERVQDTYLTHPWIAAYQEGSCAQLFMPGQPESIARLVAAPTQATGGATGGAKQEQEVHEAPVETCRKIGQDYNGVECVPRKSATPSKATVQKRAAKSCTDMGMIYLNGKCQPKYKTQRDFAKKNKNKACPAGMYRNPYGQCQPNETGG